MTNTINRRQAITATGLAAGSLCLPHVVGVPAHAATNAVGNPPQFRFCLNTSTIRGQRLPLTEQVEIAIAAGYNGIEPWIRDLQAHADGGKSLADAGKQLADAGLTVESAIGFARWIVDDEAERKKGLQDAERDMLLVKQLGGTRIAAPPVGAKGPMDLDVIAERYRAVLEVGARVGVVPQLELWGHSPAIHKLGQLIYVATEAGHRDAAMLPDVYHIYKGGSDFAGLRTIAGQRINVFHMNDYPADPPRETIGDADRVYPGDGIAPIRQILRDLAENGFTGALSLELFNPEYWKQDALEVATTGLQKMKVTVAKAFG